MFLPKSIIRSISSERIKWIEHVAPMERNYTRFWQEKTEGNEYLERPCYRWKLSNEHYLK
jgi:hypothetical protein